MNIVSRRNLIAVAFVALLALPVQSASAQSGTIDAPVAAAQDAKENLPAQTPTEQNLPEQKPPSEPGAAAVPPLPAEDVDSAIAAVKADTSIEDAAKATLITQFDEIKKSIAEGQELAGKVDSLKQLVDTAPNEVEKLKTQREALPSAEEAAEVDTSGNSSELRKTLETQRVSLKDLTDELTRVSDQLTKLEGRPVEIAARLPEASRERGEIEKKWEALPKDNASLSPADKADVFALRSGYTRLSREIALMNLEQVTQSVRQEVLEAQRDLLTRQVENAKAAIESVASRLDEELASDVDRIEELVAQALDDLPGDKEVQTLAEEIVDLSGKFRKVVENLKLATPATRRVRTRLEEVTGEYRDVRTELNLGSAGNEVAQVLLVLARRASPNEIDATIPLSLERARLDWFAAKKMRREQARVRERFSDRTSAAVNELVQARGEILDQYVAETANLTQELGELQTLRDQYFDLCEEIQKYVSEAMFGFKIRICEPIGVASLTGIPSGLVWIFSAEHFAELRDCFIYGWSDWIITSIVFCVLLLLRQPIKGALARTIPPTKRTSTDNYWWTTLAVIWTLLLAAPFAIFVLSIAWIIAKHPDPSDWMLGLSFGATSSAKIAAISGLMYEVCRSKGLGVGHFDWDPKITRRGTSILKSIIVVYVPVMMLVASTGYGDASDHLGSVGRFAFIFSHGWIAYVIYRKLYRDPERINGEEENAVANSQLLRLWQHIWIPLMIVVPLALILIACFGYMITAGDLSYGLFSSAGIIALGEIFVMLAIRAFEIRRRRMKLREALARRRAQHEAMKEADPDHESDQLLQLDEEEELGLDLSQASDQTVKFFRLLFHLAIIIILYSYWSSVIPLTATLDKIPIPITPGLSLLTLVKAILVATATFVGVRNLPGLLEFTVLRGSTIEAGTRNAIYTLCQYGVIGISLIAVSNILELDWAKFGWMAAALSVGIGFGLQEVVGNFVCGVILLFERPIRVGDVVSLDGTTGTVTNINMRATTITNWDRQELVVPNKTLITGNILNWTLSATMNRVVIPVGVAYGSDTDRAREILLQVAADHPDILDEPKPLASFEQFADSSLNLILRAYLPDLDNRLSAITALHSEIAKRFAEEGIEIPFPQQDLHLRTGLEALQESDSAMHLS